MVLVRSFTEYLGTATGTDSLSLPLVRRIVESPLAPRRSDAVRRVDRRQVAGLLRIPLGAHGWA